MNCCAIGLQNQISKSSNKKSSTQSTVGQKVVNMKDLFNWGTDLKKDIPSSLVVFLVALPLCLGIGAASEVEPITGLIAGIVGGIVVTTFSSSNFGVSGPAAGLVSIVIGAVTYFREIDPVNGYEMFLVAIILAGVFQIIMGFAKLGKLVAFFPGAVIRGMLAAIGIIIILKQIPHALGFDRDYEGDLAFNQADGKNTFTEVGNSFHAFFTGSDAITTIAPSLIFLVGIVVTLLWGTKFMKNLKVTTIISAPLVIVVAGALMVLGFEATHHELAHNHLVNLGGVEGVSDVFSYSPDFSILSDPRVYLIAFTIAMVASLESLLCMEATDKMDPEMRHTPPNRELIAQGIGNTVAGFLGGLPVTQVIVRSSANMQSGAKSKTSSFLHGWWLLLSVMLIPGAMEYVPLSALAAVLIVVGLKLAKPSIFQEYYRRGWRQFIPFMATIISIVFTDLLVGIGIGFAIALLISLYYNEVKSFKHLKDMVSAGEIQERDNPKNAGEKESVIMLKSRLSFLSKARVRELAKDAPHDRVVFDFVDVEHIDSDGQDAISEMEDLLERGGKKVRKHGGALIK